MKLKNYLYIIAILLIGIFAVWYNLNAIEITPQELRGLLNEEILGSTYIFPHSGGTGQNTNPTYGQVLVGTSGGVFSLTATSTLGIIGGGGGSGTVTSVDMSVPTGLTISGNPITTSGTLALDLDTGYQMLTDVASSTWDNKWTLADGVFDVYGQATSTKDWLLTQDNVWTGAGDTSFAGNVGIGTDSPETSLHVVGGNIKAGTAATGSSIYSGDNAYFNDDSGNDFIKLYGYWGHKFVTSGGEKMRLSRDGGLSFGSSYVTTDPGAGNVIISGNVGIGTTNPGAKLDVNGDFRANGNLTIGGIGKMVIPMSSLAISLPAQGTKVSFLNIAVNSLCRVDISSSENGFYQPTELYISRQLGAPTIVRDGIKIHEHSYDVSFSSDASGNVWMEKVLYSTGRPINITKVEQLKGTCTVLNGLTTGVGNGSDQSVIAHNLFGTNGSSIYYNIGNVGIGTTSPAYLLDVDGDFRVGEEGSSNALFVDATNGRVNIGNNNSTYNLDVTGTGRFTGALKVGAYTLPATDGTADYILKTDGSGTLSWIAQAGGFSSIATLNDLLTGETIASTTNIWDFSDYTNATASTGITFTDDAISTNDSEIVLSSLSGYDANGVIDWTTDQGVTNINAGNYTDTTYTSSDFTHNSLTGVSANEHLDWTADLGAVNINAGNYTDTNTTYTAGGTLLDLTGTTFSINEGTLTDTKYCTYEVASGIVCNSEGGGSGSGIVNYGELGSLAYYASAGTTATGTLASALMFDGTNLGIASGTPTYSLSIGNDWWTTTAGASTMSQLTVDDNVNATTTLQIGDTSNPACTKEMGTDGNWTYYWSVNGKGYSSDTSCE